jgi:alanyl-tRNA synthetase
MNHTAQYAILAALLVAGTATFAADNKSGGVEKHTITLKSGRVMEDAVILDKKPNGVTFGNKEGCTFVPYSDMPADAQKYFNYDPVKSARYEKKIDDQKKANKKAQEAQKAKEEKQKAEQDKRNKDRRISQQQQKVRKLELELEEAKKKLDKAENTVSEDRSALVSTLNNNSRVSVDTPWGVGRIRTSSNNSAVRNKLMKEVDTMSVKRDNLAQDVIDLQLKLEAAQKTLNTLLENSK